HQCTFNDNVTYTERTPNIDKYNGITSDSTDDVVRNVAPTADLANNGPVDEGSPATISFSNKFDPSSADTSAGFHYQYNCDGSAFGPVDYASASSSDSHQCTFNDNGTYTVRARIIDKDNGFTSYTTDVVVQIGRASCRQGDNGPVVEGSPATNSCDDKVEPSSADT